MEGLIAFVIVALIIGALIAWLSNDKRFCQSCGYVMKISQTHRDCPKCGMNHYDKEPPKIKYVQYTRYYQD